MVFFVDFAQKTRRRECDTYHKAGFTIYKEKGARTALFVLLFTRLAMQCIVCYTFLVLCRAVKLLVIYLARLGVIFLLRKSDVVPDGRSDILFAFVASNARSAYHRRRQYHARSAYHSPQTNRVGAPALSQVRHATPFLI